MLLIKIEYVVNENFSVYRELRTLVQCARLNRSLVECANGANAILPSALDNAPAVTCYGDRSISKRCSNDEGFKWFAISAANT